MDPTALVMEQLAHEWAACLVGFSALAMRGTVVLAVTLVIVAALASLPAADHAAPPAADNVGRGRPADSSAWRDVTPGRGPTGNRPTTGAPASAPAG